MDDTQPVSASTEASPVDNMNPNEIDSEGLTALQKAARDGDEQQVRTLLNIPGIDVNIQSTAEGWYTGFTALQWAAKTGSAECVRLLLSHPGIDVNIRNNRGIVTYSCVLRQDRMSETLTQHSRHPY